VTEINSHATSSFSTRLPRYRRLLAFLLALATR
jgi:hypothetical protein